MHDDAPTVLVHQTERLQPTEEGEGGGDARGANPGHRVQAPLEPPDELPPIDPGGTASKSTCRPAGHLRIEYQRRS